MGFYGDQFVREIEHTDGGGNFIGFFQKPFGVQGNTGLRFRINIPLKYKLI
jgi:hypothetical protein